MVAEVGSECAPFSRRLVGVRAPGEGGGRLGYLWSGRLPLLHFSLFFVLSVIYIPGTTLKK